MLIRKPIWLRKFIDFLGKQDLTKAKKFAMMELSVVL